jgi:hypothetical protein
MAGTTANVLVGGASKVEVAAYLASKVVSLTYTDIGYTMGGVTLDPKIELYNVEIDQALGILAAIPKKRDFAVKFRFAEVNMENINVLWNSPTVVITTAATTATFSLMASAGEQYVQMRLTGKGTRGAGTRTCIFWRVVPKDLGTILFKKDDIQGPEVTWQVCEDTSGANTTATYGTIVDT